LQCRLGSHNAAARDESELSRSDLREQTYARRLSAFVDALEPEPPGHPATGTGG
jgi:hypothetical protein